NFTASRFKRIVWQETEKTLWAITFDGALASMTIDEEAQVAAWAYHPIGGELDGGLPEVIDISMTLIGETGYETPLLLVKRTIGGNDVISMEYLAPIFDSPSIDLGEDDAPFVPVFLDCATVVFPQTPTTTIAGLDD